MPAVTPASAKASMTLAFQSLERASTSLQSKTNWLKAHRSTDPIQQMQTDAIVDLAEAVKKIQEALWPMSLLIPDGIEAVKEAAGGGTGVVNKATLLSTQINAFKR